jgi:serine/threonine protein kinase
MDHHEIYTGVASWGSVDTAGRYERLHRIGEGAFGEVRLGRCRRTGRDVALKAVQVPVHSGGLPKAVFREMEALRQLSSPNVIALIEIYPQETNIVLVLEHAYTDLGSIICTSNEYLDSQFVKQMAFMIINGLSHCHGAGIIHRDIKPSNVLITSDGVAKLGDFGLARVYDSEDGRSMSHQVSTRWYRAPELLFASRHYGPSMDVWSVGAVLAELISLCPLFPGTNDIDQMFRVFQVMGTPSPENWPVSTSIVWNVKL